MNQEKPAADKLTLIGCAIAAVILLPLLLIGAGKVLSGIFAKSEGQEFTYKCQQELIKRGEVNQTTSEVCKAYGEEIDAKKR